MKKVWDDFNNIRSKRTRKERRNWVFGTILPGIEMGCIIILLGVVLAEHSLLYQARLRQAQIDRILDIPNGVVGEKVANIRTRVARWGLRREVKTCFISQVFKRSYGEKLLAASQGRCPEATFEPCFDSHEQLMYTFSIDKTCEATYVGTPSEKAP